MISELHLAASDQTTLDSLREWLEGEDELRGRIRRGSATPLPGHMGVLQEAIIVAVGGGGALSALAASLRFFFSQPRREDIKIEIRTEDGRSILIDSRRVKNSEAILRAILENLHSNK